MPGSRWVASLLVAGALAACADDGSERRAAPAPSIGAESPVASATPSRPMDRLEQPVADRLAPRLRDEGLTLEYVDCPRWSGSRRVVMRCKGYVDGVVGEVEVELSEHRGHLEFDAWLSRGVVATSRLVERLQDQGHTSVDCGEVPAYPARQGMTIVCRVEDAGVTSHVVATVTGRSGAVEIERY
jgi:hypothetical protein